MEATIQCPWCFEIVVIWLDPGLEGEMVHDCEVCCRPWVMWVRRRGDGGAEVEVQRGN